jgi:hypothetical protein
MGCPTSPLPVTMPIEVIPSAGAVFWKVGLVERPELCLGGTPRGKPTQGVMDETVHRRNPHRAQVVDLRQQALEHGYRNLDYIHPPARRRHSLTRLSASRLLL